MQAVNGLFVNRLCHMGLVECILANATNCKGGRGEGGGSPLSFIYKLYLFIYLLKAQSTRTGSPQGFSPVRISHNYLFIEGLYDSPVNRTGSTLGFSQVQISHKLNTIIQNMHVP